MPPPLVTEASAPKKRDPNSCGQAYMGAIGLTGTKAKEVVLQYVLDNVPAVLIDYTRHGNPKPQCYDKADSWVIAHAGWIQECQKLKK